MSKIGFHVIDILSDDRFIYSSNLVGKYKYYKEYLHYVGLQIFWVTFITNI